MYDAHVRQTLIRGWCAVDAPSPQCLNWIPFCVLHASPINDYYYSHVCILIMIIILILQHPRSGSPTPPLLCTRTHKHTQAATLSDIMILENRMYGGSIGIGGRTTKMNVGRTTTRLMHAYTGFDIYKWHISRWPYCFCRVY